MADHPYAGPNTLSPGDVADDDPFVEDGTYCGECDEEVELTFGECPLCGKDLEE